MEIRQAIEYEQKEGIIKPSNDDSGYLYFDPLGIVTFADLVTNMAKHAVPTIRKRGFENFLKHHQHETFKFKKGKILVVQDAKYDKSEWHIAEKLAKSGQIVLFPKQGDLGKGRKNDVYLYDPKTYIQTKTELKSLFGYTAEVIRSQLISGSGQAGVIAYDIQSGIKKNWLIEGLRNGWNDNLKFVMLNYKGQWHQLSRKEVFSETIYKTLK
jgi:hypothetical protein